MSTIEAPTEFDALEKAKPDELIFTLLERDPDAPGAILHWCESRRRRARDIEDPKRRRAELVQATEAESIAFEMESRQRGGEACDVGSNRVAVQGAGYPGAEIDAALTALRGKLSEADYHLAAALDTKAGLAGQYLDGKPLVTLDQHERLRAAQEAVHALVMEFSPRRQALNKAVGYDPKLMRQCVRLRAMKPDDRAEMEAVLDVYKAALGMGSAPLLEGGV